VRRGERVTYAARFPRSESVDLGIARAEHSPTVIEWDVDRIRAILAERDERIRVLAELPEAEVVGLAREARRIGARVLYDKIDAWERCDFATWYSRGDEAAMIGEADDLIGTARPLVRSLAAAKRPVHYLPNAVDLELFAPLPRDTAPPADAPRGDVNLVYAGALWGDWFDWDLIVAIAAARPSWTIALIRDPPRTERALPANVRLLGLKPQRALPAYLATADACLIPFRRTPLTEGVSPLKFFEYLAMRRPVIATRLGELAGAPYVSFVDDADRAIAAVERAVATPPRKRRSSVPRAPHGPRRAASLVSLTARPSIAVIVLRRGGPAALRGCLESLLAGRGEQSYRIAVVDDGSDGRDDEELAAREEAGEIVVLRSALRGNSASRNLGIRATQSELVAFVDAEQRVSGPGWLDAAVRLLVDDRRIGAVGSTGGWVASPDGRSGRIEAREEWSASPPSHARSVRTDVAYLGAGGLVVPRAVWPTQGFDERYDPRGCAGLDLSFQIREAGYVLALSPDIGILCRIPRRPSSRRPASCTSRIGVVSLPSGSAGPNTSRRPTRAMRRETWFDLRRISWRKWRRSTEGPPWRNSNTEPLTAKGRSSRGPSRQPRFRPPSPASRTAVSYRSRSRSLRRSAADSPASRFPPSASNAASRGAISSSSRTR
jgi:glycosyltransferase involved in cell wall biosynthesis